ncbi:MAG: cation transporter [Candidatus Levybacteria bacterium]|nr:cation transporter [Candidatus Levybacteria bacterium]
MNKVLLKKALRLEYLTIAWNVIEGVLSILIGVMSGSVALIAYGLSSSVEVFTSGLVVWDLKGTNKDREKISIRLIGCAYLIVALYIFIDATMSIVSQKHPEASPLGILVLIASFIIMLILGISKKRIAEKIQSHTFLAGAKFSLVDAGLSFTVMIGLLTNAVFGWWWMDQSLALFLAGVAFSEGIGELLS